MIRLYERNKKTFREDLLVQFCTAEFIDDSTACKARIPRLRHDTDFLATIMARKSRVSDVRM